MIRMLKETWWNIHAYVYPFFTGYRHSTERVCADFPGETFEAHLDVYRFASQFVAEKTVLDVGCGTGYGSYYLAQERATKLNGIDYSEEAIRYARSHYKHPNVEFQQMDAQSLGFRNGSFDVVFSSENLEHLLDPEKNIQEIRRVLKTRGILILGTPNKEVTSPGMEKCPNPFHIKEFYFSELRDLLLRYFSQVHIFENSYAGSNPVGLQIREDRYKRGDVGIIVPSERGVLAVGELMVNTKYLNNTHSFIALAW